MYCSCVCLLGALLLPIFAFSSDISELQGEADYRFVRLHWRYPATDPPPNGFQIYYCELQAWGPNRCRTKLLDGDAEAPSGDDSQSRVYSVVVPGLRMATNYSFEVQSRELRRTRVYIHTFPRWSPHPSPQHNRIIIPTKGFSARASLCLPDVSEVEVSTGPYFGGRIAVETAPDSQHCLVDGDGTSPRETYKLKIDHQACGSQVNRTAVETFILVQENLPILTHSTRRFLVLCTFQPETLTVRAGLNLPSTSSGAGAEGFGVGSSAPESPESAAAVNEIIDNNVQASALQVADEAARAYAEQTTEVETVMFAVVIAAGMVAVGLTVWWFIPIKSKSSRQSVISEDNSYASNSTVYENYENSLRDSELDFGIDDESCREETEDNILKEGVYNEILHETCSSLTLDSLPTVTIECTTHSEA